MTQFYVGSAPYGEDYSVLEIVRKDGSKIRFDGDYHHVSITDANGASIGEYLDPVETWEEFSAIVKEFLGEKKVSVGLNDCTGKVFHFNTVEDAEEAIALLETVIPVSVHAGEYFIDVPEELEE
jgi:hypothetical protein